MDPTCSGRSHYPRAHLARSRRCSRRRYEVRLGHPHHCSGRNRKHARLERHGDNTRGHCTVRGAYCPLRRCQGFLNRRPWRCAHRDAFGAASPWRADRLRHGDHRDVGLAVSAAAAATSHHRGSRLDQCEYLYTHGYSHLRPHGRVSGPERHYDRALRCTSLLVWEGPGWTGPCQCRRRGHVRSRLRLKSCDGGNPGLGCRSGDDFSRL